MMPIGAFCCCIIEMLLFKICIGRLLIKPILDRLSPFLENREYIIVRHFTELDNCVCQFDIAISITSMFPPDEAANKYLYQMRALSDPDAIPVEPQIYDLNRVCIELIPI